MDLWCASGDRTAEGLPGLLARLEARGISPVLRDLSDALADPAQIPRLIWQADNDPAARTRWLMDGADDVIGPWMDEGEALARILRLGRVPPANPRNMVLGDLDIDMVERQARREDRPLALLGREYQLLVQLARLPGHVQSRAALLQAVWRLRFDPGTNVVEVHVSRLRAKLDRGFPQPMLHTVRGQGYCLMAPA